jgi:hypothetical protein
MFPAKSYYERLMTSELRVRPAAAVPAGGYRSAEPPALTSPFSYA